MYNQRLKQATQSNRDELKTHTHTAERLRKQGK